MTSVPDGGQDICLKKLGTGKDVHPEDEKEAPWTVRR